MNQSSKGVFFTIAGGSCWGMSGVMGKYLFDMRGLNAAWLVTVRLLAAGIIMLAIAYKSEKNGIFRVWKHRETAVGQLIFSIVGMAACQMTYFLAIEYSNPGTATVLQYIFPVIVMLFYIIVEKRIPGILEVIVLISVMVGVFLMATHGNIGNLAITSQALFWGLTSAAACTVYNIQPKQLLKEFGTMTTVGWGMLIGGICVAPFTKVWSVPGTWDGMTFLLTAGVILVGTVIAFGCYLHGVSLLGPVRGSMFGCVEPLVATILSVLILKEVFSAMDVLGIACIVAGVTALAVFDRDSGAPGVNKQ